MFTKLRVYKTTVYYFALKFDKAGKICYTIRSYKSVTKNYKGVIIIGSIRIKIISVILAVLFTLGGTAYAYAEDSQKTEAVTEAAVGAEVTKNAPSSPAAETVQDIKVTSVTDSSAVLRWKSDSVYKNFKICKYNKKSGKWEKYLTSAKNKVKLTGLSADTDYKFGVMQYESGELIGVAAFRTGIKKPEIRVKNVRSNKVTLSFKNLTKGATLELYRKSKKKDYKKIATLKDKKTYTDKKLKGATSYSYKLKVKSNSGKSATSKAKSVKTLKKMGLPSVSGKTKTYAYYTAVTLKSSPQYKLLRSSKCYTDSKTGIRMVDDCYCVALGSYYGTKIGTKYKITFSNGNTIKVILCDQKANRHTDRKHQYAVNNKDIVEFYVEKSKMPKSIRNRGNYGILPQFSGSVVSIEKYV